MGAAIDLGWLVSEINGENEGKRDIQGYKERE
jgi:hypothetical protein